MPEAPSPAGAPSNARDRQRVGVLRRRGDWAEAVQHFRKLANTHRNDVDAKVKAFGGIFAGEPAAMVVDVVLSNRRKHERDVRPLLDTWMSVHPGMTFADLAESGPGPIPRLRNDKRSDEAATIQTVAAGLVEYCRVEGIDEATGIGSWSRPSGAASVTL